MVGSIHSSARLVYIRIPSAPLEFTNYIGFCHMGIVIHISRSVRSFIRPQPPPPGEKSPQLHWESGSPSPFCGGAWTSYLLLCVLSLFPVGLLVGLLTMPRTECPRPRYSRSSAQQFGQRKWRAQLCPICRGSACSVGSGPCPYDTWTAGKQPCPVNAYVMW